MKGNEGVWRRMEAYGGICSSISEAYQRATRGHQRSSEAIIANSRQSAYLVDLGTRSLEQQLDNLCVLVLERMLEHLAQRARVILGGRQLHEHAAREIGLWKRGRRSSSEALRGTPRHSMVVQGHPGPFRARAWFHLTASSSARCIWSCRRLSFFSASCTTRTSLVVLSDDGVGALRDAFIDDP